MFFAPAKAGRKVSARFKVRELPDVETLDPAPLSVHWLLVWLPLPGVMPDAGWMPASVNSHKVFSARLKLTTQPFTVETAVLKFADTLVRSAAPAPSVYSKVNVCDVPLPELGDTPPIPRHSARVRLVTKAPYLRALMVG